jgi:ABC-type glycerol-3-phosphate transport system substrate-binding protein
MRLRNNLMLTLSSAALCLAAGSNAAFAEDIVFWVNAPLANGPDAPIYESIAAFEEETGHTVEVQAVPHSELERNLFVALSSGAGPDVMALDVAWVAGFADAGFLADISEQTQPIADDYMPGPLASGRYAGQQYALPLYTNNVALYVNDDMLAEAGIDGAPATWDAFRQAAVAMTELGDDSYGLTLGGNRYGAFQLYSFIWQNGGEIIDEDGTVLVDDPAAIEAVDFLSSLYTEDGAIPDSVLTAQSWDEVNAPFIQERAGMLITGDWGIGAIERGNPDLNYSIHPLPAGEERATVIGGYDIAVNAASDAEEASFALARWLTGPHSVELMREYNRLSASSQAAQEDEIETLPENMQPFMRQAPYGHARPVVPAWGQIHADIFGNVWDSVIREQETPEEAMTRAAGEIEALMQQ